jgi:chorismate synthase
MVAYVIADELIEKIGGDSIAEMQNRFRNLAQPRLNDIHLDGKEHTFWEA